MQNAVAEKQWISVVPRISTTAVSGLVLMEIAKSSTVVVAIAQTGNIETNTELVEQIANDVEHSRSRSIPSRLSPTTRGIRLAPRRHRVAEAKRQSTQLNKCLKPAVAPFNSTLNASRPAKLSRAMSLAPTQWKQVSMSGWTSVCLVESPCQSHWNSSLRNCTARNVLWSCRASLSPESREGQGTGPSRSSSEGGRQGPDLAFSATSSDGPRTVRGFFGGGEMHLRLSASHFRGLLLRARDRLLLSQKQGVRRRKGDRLPTSQWDGVLALPEVRRQVESVSVLDLCHSDSAWTEVCRRHFPCLPIPLSVLGCI